MNDKTILIECDEMTKDIMKDLEGKMNESFSNSAKNLSDDIKESLVTIEESIEKFKRSYKQDNEDTLEEVEENIKELSKNIQDKLDRKFEEITANQNRILSEYFLKIFEGIDGVKASLEDSDKKVLSKAEEMNNAIKEIRVITSNLNVSDEIINLENSLNKKLENIQREAEWGNKPFWTRIFGKRD